MVMGLSRMAVSMFRWSVLSMDRSDLTSSAFALAGTGVGGLGFGPS